MRVLITGGFGYLGSKVALNFSTYAGYEIILGSRHPPREASWLPQATVVETKWETTADLEKICTGIDAIIHMAGMNAKDCASDPVSALQVNAVATARLLQAAVRQGVRRFVHLSTAHVYGNPLTGVIGEENCPVSLHPYAVSHRTGEDVVLDFHQRGEIEGVVIRLSNAFGAPAHKEANCWMLLVNNICRQAAETDSIVLHSTGVQRRDFIPLTDACAAIKHLLELPIRNVGDGLFNVGGRWAPTILEMTERVAARIHAATGRRLEILRKTDQSPSQESVLNYKIEKLIATGYCPRDPANVNNEIDQLIQFCMKQFKRNL